MWAQINIYEYAQCLESTTSTITTTTNNNNNNDNYDVEEGEKYWRETQNIEKIWSNDLCQFCEIRLT